MFSEKPDFPGIVPRWEQYRRHHYKGEAGVRCEREGQEDSTASREVCKDSDLNPYR